MTDDDQIDETGDALQGQLSAMFLRTDPVPDAVMAAARAAIELRDLDAQLAELLSDSALEDKEVAGVRGSIGGRLLSFGFGERFLEVDVADDGAHRSITGYVVPGGGGRLVAEFAGGTAEAEVDDHGRFRLPRVPRGPVRLRFVAAGLAPLLTPWLPI